MGGDDIHWGHVPDEKDKSTYLMLWRAKTPGSSTLKGRMRKEGEKRGAKKRSLI